ncbi:VOC family protein [Chelatococcus sp. SYSU_G07232]|uniref:VOC family protein n=1 Tax=Chelatococcus albus TaxID=3047466 RepID=A0ABT7AE26_9HYPH|nr:VOC family protein [Chelatococcus sp. SYSU_G07232]MDJ1156851.1 VOC family protein [Chelatococcus sp. SYSU_G07232]
MPRGIDHLVFAVRDLDAAGAFHERLGFTVGARNRHPWGTENRIVQFPGVFLELITVGEGAEIAPHGPRSFSFGAFVRDYLARREGLAMLVLESKDAAADAAAFRAAGVGDFDTFFFERRARRPDGSETQVAFTLAFAEDLRAPQAGFFVCQQHFPENFWNPAFQRHPNGATGITAAVMVAENPSDHHAFLSAFTGERDMRATSLGVTIGLPRGRIEVLTPAAAAEIYGFAETSAEPRLIGFAVAVPDLREQARRLGESGIAFLDRGGRLTVPSGRAFGAAITFEAASGGGARAGRGGGYS